MRSQVRILPGVPVETLAPSPAIHGWKVRTRGVRTAHRRGGHHVNVTPQTFNGVVSKLDDLARAGIGKMSESEVITVSGAEDIVDYGVYSAGQTQATQALGDLAEVVMRYAPDGASRQSFVQGVNELRTAVGQGRTAYRLASETDDLLKTPHRFEDFAMPDPAQRARIEQYFDEVGSAQ